MNQRLLNFPVYILPFDQAASNNQHPDIYLTELHELTLIQTNGDDNRVFLSLICNKPYPALCYAPLTENYHAPAPEIILQQGTMI